ncbi:MAG TPA: hypothetical protein VK936_09180 [Longimicrobiales bacterium]|nr:hypothetical protein [Longimicrobiales bacterium]
MRINPATAAAMLVILAAATSACASAARGYAGDGIRLFVGNEGWDPVEVFVERPGAEDSLGRVWRHQYVRFDLDDVSREHASDVVIRIVSQAGDTLRTGAIRARPGSAIDMRLQTPLRHSRWRHH